MTGVLPIGLGRATKVMPVVVHSVKEYVGVMELHKVVSEDEMKRVFKLFEGKVIQRPPLKSSVKRVPRVRRIHLLELLEVDGKLLLFRVRCDPGTYIRKLCHDIGIMLRVGAHLRELRRVKSGPFTEEGAVTLHELSEAVYAYKEKGEENALSKLILPSEVGTCMLPKIIVRDSAVEALAHGAWLTVRGVVAFTNDLDLGSVVAVLSMKGELLQIGKALIGGRDLPELGRGVIVRPFAVLVQRGLYPRVWGAPSGGGEVGGA